MIFEQKIRTATVCRNSRRIFIVRHLWLILLIVPYSLKLKKRVVLSHTYQLNVYASESYIYFTGDQLALWLEINMGYRIALLQGHLSFLWPSHLS